MYLGCWTNRPRFAIFCKKSTREDCLGTKRLASFFLYRTTKAVCTGMNCKREPRVPLDEHYSAPLLSHICCSGEIAHAKYQHKSNLPLMDNRTTWFLSLFTSPSIFLYSHMCSLLYILIRDNQAGRV
ncbi:unnamed protein product, partial [Ectocarpus sp. 13 AM-2016]